MFVALAVQSCGTVRPGAACFERPDTTGLIEQVWAKPSAVGLHGRHSSLVSALLVVLRVCNSRAPWCTLPHSVRLTLWDRGVVCWDL